VSASLAALRADPRIPFTDDGVPRVDLQVIGEVVARFPDLRMGFEEYLALGADVHGDWIDGRLRLAGSETDLHSNLSGFLSALIQSYAEEHAGGGEAYLRFVMRARSDLPAREVDLLYVAPENLHRIRHCFVDGPADLVVEITTGETRERDRVEKFSEYERGGVREYWLVDTEAGETEVYRLNGAGRFERVPAGDPPLLRSEVLPGMWLRPEWLREASMPKLQSVLREWGLL
jgi:Uma2 family endonuclease